jgi:hypothetical protein
MGLRKVHLDHDGPPKPGSDAWWRQHGWEPPDDSRSWPVKPDGASSGGGETWARLEAQDLAPPDAADAVHDAPDDAMSALLPPRIELLAIQASAAFGRDVELISRLMLSTISHALAPWLEADCGLFRQPLSHWSLWVADPSSKKSPVISRICAPMFDLHGRLEKESKLEHQRWESQMANVEDMHRKGERTADDVAAIADIEPPQICGVLENTTSAFMFDAMAGGLAAFASSEGDSFFRSALNAAGPNGDSSVSALCKAYDRDRISVGRKAWGLRSVEKPCMTVVIATQPHVFNGLDESIQEQGLLARVGVYRGTAAVEGVECGLPDDWVMRWGEAFDAAWRKCSKRHDWCVGKPFPSQPILISMRPDAHELFMRVAAMVEAGHESAAAHGFAYQWGKLHGRALRLAGLAAALDWALKDKGGELPVIDRRTVMLAVQAALLELRTTREALGDVLGGESGADRDAREVAARVAAAVEAGELEIGATMRDMRPKLGRRLSRDTDARNAACDRLVACGFLKRDKRAGARRAALVLSDVAARPSSQGGAQRSVRSLLEECWGRDKAHRIMEERASHARIQICMREMAVSKRAGITPMIGEMSRRYRVPQLRDLYQPIV